MAWVLLTLAPCCALVVMSVCNILFVELLFLFGVFGEMCDVNQALHGTLGSYLRDALEEGNADVVAYLHVPRA
jgi:hypothetical protein